MKLPDWFSQAPALFIGGTALCILALYLIRQAPRRVIVGSTLLWRGQTGARHPRSARWRWWMSLLLALAIACSLASGLVNPQAQMLGLTVSRLTLVLDNAPSMASRTQDGQSRWQHAVQAARRMIEQRAGTASEFLVADTMGQASAAGFQRASNALQVLNALTPAAYGAPRMPALAPAKAGASEVHLFTDGVARLTLIDAVQVESVFEPAANLALLNLQVRRASDDPTAYHAVVEVLNAGTRAQQGQLELQGAGAPVLRRTLSLPAGRSTRVVLDVSAFDAGVLRAAITGAADAFPFDDAAYTVLEPHRRWRVLLVSPDPGPLERALQQLPGVDVQVVKPADYAASRLFDICVFDRFAPELPPQQGVLLFRPPAVSWLPERLAEVHEPGISRWDEASPLGKALAWRSLQIRDAVLLKPAADANRAQATVVFAGKSPYGALISVSHTVPAWIHVGFSLADSNLALQPGFLVLLGAALNRLAPREEVVFRGLGAVELLLPQARVTDSEGRPVAVLPTERGPVVEASRPAVYRFHKADRQGWLVINQNDGEAARINARGLGAHSAPKGWLPAIAWPLQPWSILVLLGLGLLLLEWMTFTRRITV